MGQRVTGFLRGARRSYAKARAPSSPRKIKAVFEHISAVLTLAGGLTIALSGAGNFIGVAIGSIILFIGFNLFVPMCWAWEAENYPTRARASGFALVDGIGHIGGGVGMLVLVPFMPTLGPIGTFLVLGGFLVISSAVAQFGISTRARRLDEVSP